MSTSALPPELTDGTVTLRLRSAGEGPGAGRALSFTVERDGPSASSRGSSRPVEPVGSVEVDDLGDGVGALHWELDAAHRRQGYATHAVRLLVDWALTDVSDGGGGWRRIQARVGVGDEASLRVATRAGLLREGVERQAGTNESATAATDLVVLARLAADPPLSDPASFRRLLNSVLPRKRGIAQMLVRDELGRVLMCQLTYKRDWDLPGGVVEVGESPRLAVTREVEEELGLAVEAGALLLTDWLPPWGGWDDALCLVFDGGVLPSDVVARIVKQEREIRDAQFLTPEQVRARATDFTARRVEAALAGDRSYTESGR